MYRQKNNRNERRGAALVEFAVILPIILLCFASMIEFSRVLLLQHTADTSAYEAARAAMIPGATTDDGFEAAASLLRANRLKKSVVTISPEQIVESTSLITVQVEIPVALNSWLPPFWFTRSTVKSEVTLFCERPPLVMLTGVPQIKSKGNAATSSADDTDDTSSTLSTVTGLATGVVGSTVSSVSSTID